MSDNNGGGCGCLSIIVFVLLVWALLFGVTVGGKHYGLKGCNSEQGIQIDK